MRIDCIHGYFIFTEIKSGSLSRFQSLFGLDIVKKDSYFTFDFLQNAPRYSIIGKTYLGSNAVATFEGDPWEVMRSNDLIYDFTKNQVVPIGTISTRIQLSLSGFYFISPGLILPGSVTDGGLRVTDYSAWYSFDTGKFKYSEVAYG